MIRWKKMVKIDYKAGDIRIVRRFLLWPVCIQDEWRWLGVSLIKQKLVSRYGGVHSSWNGFVLRWNNVEWVSNGR